MTTQEKKIQVAKEGGIKYLVFDLDDKRNQLKVNGETYKNISYIRYDVKHKLYNYYNIEDVIVYVSEKALTIFTNEIVYIHDDDLYNQILMFNYFKDLLMCKYIVD